jgi:hypothetical protein
MQQNTPTNGSRPATITTGEDLLVIERFGERDPEVVNLVAAAEDAESAVHRCLQTGARALGLAQVSLDASIVEHAFDGMSQQIGGQLDEAVKQIVGVTDALFDEDDGGVTQSLNGWREDVAKLLGETFDPESKRSVLAKLEGVLDEARERQVEAIRRVVDPDREDSPLGRHRTEIVKVVREGQQSLEKAIQEISEKIAVERAQAELIEKTAGKGFSFEDTVHEAVSEIAAVQGDVAERTGTTTGAAGSKCGDEVVTINPEDTRGIGARYAFELKDRKLGLNAILAELDAAIENREAAAAVAVFARAELSPVAAPFVTFGDRAIVVFDKETLDAGALRLACMWARWVARRELGDDGAGLDIARIESLIEGARRALDRVSNVRRCHTTAVRKIEEASGQVGDMAREFESALDALAAEISA